MADEFETEAGLTETELQAIYSSKYLSAADVGDRKIKTKILRVSSDMLRQQDGRMRKKAILSLEGLDKQVVVNTTNFLILKTGLGANPSKWIGASIGIKTKPSTMAGKPVMSIELVVLDKTFKASAAPMPPKPAPKPVPSPLEDVPWPDEAGDPGFNDDPNFDHA
jgi:hypothetical protein